MRKFATITVLLVFALIAFSANAAAQGADLYKGKCQMCHGADGKADTAMGKKMNIRSFSDPAVVKATDAQLIEITTKGKDKMPAYEGKLTADQIKAVIAFVRELQKK